MCSISSLFVALFGRLSNLAFTWSKTSAPKPTQIHKSTIDLQDIEATRLFAEAERRSRRIFLSCSHRYCLPTRLPFIPIFNMASNRDSVASNPAAVRLISSSSPLCTLESTSRIYQPAPFYLQRSVSYPVSTTEPKPSTWLAKSQLTWLERMAMKAMRMSQRLLKIS